MTARRAKPARRARAALTWTAALFAAAQAGQLAAGRDPEFAEKRALLRAQTAVAPDRPLLLVLGSSRVLRGVRPERLERLTAPAGRPYRAFNFGLFAAGPIRMRLALRRLRDDGIRPSLVLVEVMTPFFNEPGRGRFSEEECLRDVRLSAAELLRLRPYLERPGRVCEAWLRSRALPCVGQRRELTDWLLPGWRPATPESDRVNECGWWPYPEDVAPGDRAAMVDAAKRQYGASFPDFRVGAGPLRALADLLADCRRDGVRVVLLLTPESSAFRGWDRGASATLLRRLDELPGAAERIDARDWVADGDFWDAHHLLPRGATAFSDRLAAELGRWLAHPTGGGDARE